MRISDWSSDVCSSDLARYDFPVAGLDGHVQFAVNHIGKRRSDLRTFENALVGDFKAYTTADVSIGAKADDWTAERFATNVFDSRGIVNSAVQSGESICGDPDGLSSTRSEEHTSELQ